MGKILVHGFINIDQIAIVENFKLDQETNIEEFKVLPGGSAANVAVGLSRLLDKEIKFLGAMGKDSYSSLLLNSMEKVNIDSIQKIDNKVSGFTFTVVNEDGLRTMFTYPGANLNYDVSTIDSNTFEDVDLIHFSSPKLKTGSDILNRLELSDTKVSFDPGALLTINGLPYLEDIFSKVDILFLNEDEQTQLFPNNSLKTSLKILHDMGIETIFIKLGSNGALMSNYEKNNISVIKKTALEINPLDSTGAGDAFSVGALYGVVKGLVNSEILEGGIKNSAAVMENIGARKGLLYKIE